MGWEAKPDESGPTTILRTHLISVLSGLNDTAVVAEAQRRYAAQATDPKAVPVALRKTILSVVAHHADAATWDKLHEEAKAEKTPQVKDRLYTLLAVAEDKALAQRALRPRPYGRAGRHQQRGHDHRCLPQVSRTCF
ncbi:ERAP1 domain protein [Dyella terrae]|nr:ERAP1 domain protein [Dyella terrae]